MERIEVILRYFPMQIQKVLNGYGEQINEIEEIRIRVGRNIMLKARNYESVLEYTITQNDIMNILEKVCDNSIYAYRNQIANGYITIRGGHRIGIIGTCVVENGEVVNVKNITSMNIRIAQEIHGAADKIIREIINVRQNEIYNTLIVSPPRKRQNNNT